jgi:nucleotidyltransferase substrate binding protein (TIGR01987 family)
MNEVIQFMTAKDIQLTELKRAVSRLKEVLTYPKNDIIRDSAIQRFEFTVELSWKVLQRYLRSSGYAEHLTPKQTIREAARLGLITDPEAWIRFIDARNLSSHTYREALAEEVFTAAQTLPVFVDELLVAIERVI